MLGQHSERRLASYRARDLANGRSVLIIALLLIIVAASLSILAYLSLNYHPSVTPNPCDVINSQREAPGIANSSVTGTTATFTIIESDPGNPYEGMNGSAYHLSTSWPVMQVMKGQKVTIHVINCASSEPHGFAITHYFNQGVALQAGHSYTITFVADQTGTFRVYCNIFCSIHALMQNGELIVS